MHILVQKFTGADPTNTIFVKNLPYDITEDEVGDLFRHCGAIDNVRFSYHPFHKHFKGYICLKYLEIFLLNNIDLVTLTSSIQKRLKQL